MDSSRRRSAVTAAEPISSGPFREAPAAFDNRTNGFDPRGPAFDTLNEDTVVALRSRDRLMHDGLSFTKQEAIGRHAGQAGAAKTAFDGLASAQKAALMAFLDSL